MIRAGVAGPFAVAVADRTAATLDVLSDPDGAAGAVVLERVDGMTTGFRYVDGASWRTSVVSERHGAAGSGSTGNRRPWRVPTPRDADLAVVICTVGRSPLLGEAVRAVLAQDPRVREVVVVDNAPSTGAVGRALAGFDSTRLRIVNQPIPGLSHARNAGLAAVSADVVAFTDDDAAVDPGWAWALAQPMLHGEGGDIGATTGLVAPMRLETPSQVRFERRGGFVRDTEPRLWRTIGPRPPMSWGEEVDGGPLYPMTTARVGAGVSMAFRREVLEQIGGFDPELGAGTPSMGGEDLDAFSRTMAAGFAILYTPDAVVWHCHRTDDAGLECQVLGSGVGMGALFAKAVVTSPINVARAAGRIPRVAARVLDRRRAAGPRDEEGTPEPHGRGLVAVEARGFARGFAHHLPVAVRQRRRRTTPTGR